MSDVTVTLTREEHRALLETLDNVRLVPGDMLGIEAVRTLDLLSAREKLEAAARVLSPA